MKWTICNLERQIIVFQTSLLKESYAPSLLVGWIEDWIFFQASPAEEDDDDDDVDLFGEETEEEKKASEERAAAVKASGKKKECKPKSLVTRNHENLILL